MPQQAQLYRMVMPQHICPFGIKSKDLLKRKGFEVDDHLLKSHAETETLKTKLGVDTTPQTFIDGKRIGGYSDLRRYFGLSDIDNQKISYTPVIAVFVIALLMAVALVRPVDDTFTPLPIFEKFIALAMCLLALQKLRDLYAFTNQFITYDLLSMRFVRYAYIYPFAETYAGLGMLAKLPTWWVSPIALFIGAIGAISVVKAVYIDKRELKCACVGGNSKVPLGFVSLTENIFMMVGAGLMWTS